MRKLLPNLLAGLFNMIGSASSVAALPMCVDNPVIPTGFAAFAMLAVVYQSLSAKRSEGEIDSQLDTLLRSDAVTRQDAIEIARLAELPADGCGAQETPLRLLYESLKAQIQSHGFDPDLADKLRNCLEANAALPGRAAATLLDNSNGLAEALASIPSMREDLRNLTDEVASYHKQIFDHLSRTLFYPRLTLPLYAYSLDGSATLRLYYGGRRVSLVGRETELRKLHEFLSPQPQAEHDVLWWLWTGPAGIGKSRLGLELCLQAIQLGYRAGFWDRNDEFGDWDKWIVDKPTLVIVDYVSERAELVREGIVRLFQHPLNNKSLLRLLLLERSADEQRDEWYRKFNRASSTTERLALEQCRYEPPIACQFLDDDALRTIFGEVFAEYEVSFPIDDVLRKYREIDQEGRPLLAAAAAEAVVHGNSPEQIRDWSRADLVKAMVNREVDRWRDAGIDDSHLNLLIYATILRGCEKSDADSLHERGLRVPGPEQRNQRWLHIMSSYGFQEESDRIHPLAPDMLGEWTLLERLAGRIDLSEPNPDTITQGTTALLQSAWETNPLITFHFILRTVQDFVDHEQIPALFSNSMARVHPELFGFLVANVVYIFTVNHQEVIATSLIERLGRLRDSSPDVIPGLVAAYYNLGAAHRQLGANKRTIEDFTRVIEIPDAPVDLVVMALNGRALAYGTLDQHQDAINDFTRVIECADAPPEEVAHALNNRGVAHGRLGATDLAIDDLSRSIELPGAPPEEVVSALTNRGIGYNELEQPQEAIDDFTRVIECADAPPEEVARALTNRGVAYDELGASQLAIDDYTRVIELPNAPPEQVAAALYNRGNSYDRLEQPQEAIDEYAQVIEFPDAPPELVAKALLNRGNTYGTLGQPQTAIDDFTHTIELPNAPPAQVARALNARGQRYGQLREAQQESDDYTRVIELPEAPPEDVAGALYNRGVTYGTLGQPQKAIDDFTRAIELANAPPELVAKALTSRGITYDDIGQSRKAVDDFTRAIELPDAPPELVAKALYDRGVSYRQRGSARRAIADFTRVIELPNASSSQVAAALNNRGSRYEHSRRPQKAIDDFTRAIELPDAPPDEVAAALYNRGVTYGTLGQPQKAIDDFTRAIELPDAPPELVAKGLVGTVVVGDLERSEKCRRLAKARRLALELGHDELATGVMELATTLGCDF